MEPNINISSKLLEKVFDAIFEPNQIIRKAKAEAKADNIKRVAKAKTDLEVLPLEQKLKNQITVTAADYQQMQSIPYPENGTTEEKANYYLIQKAAESLYQDLNYYNNIVFKAAEMTKDEEVSDTPLNPRFLERHKALSQNEIDEEMQSLWARILSEEIKKSDSASIRAMEMLDAMSKSDLELIKKAASFEVLGSINEIALKLSSTDSPLGADALSFEDIHYLHEIGILSTTSHVAISDANSFDFTVWRAHKNIGLGYFKVKFAQMKIGTKGHYCFFAPYSQKALGFHNSIKFTQAGMVLVRVENVPLHPKFLDPFLNKMTEYGFDQRCILPDHLANRFKDGEYNFDDDIVELAENHDIDFNRYRVDKAEGSNT